jgi:predicted PurR-regulated permease PerM
MDANRHHSVYFLLVCIIALFALVTMIISPFIGALIVASVFAFLFQPIYKRLQSYTKDSQKISALITTVVAIIIILLPLSFIGFQIFKESTELYKNVIAGDTDVFAGVIENFINKTGGVLPLPENFQVDFKQYAEKGLSVLIQNLGLIFSSVTKTLLNLVVFLTAFYFFLKDGHKLKDYFVELSPLADKDDGKIIDRLRMAVSATVKGSLSIGLIQGTLTGIGFAIFGVPNPALWGSLAAITALIPGIGTSIVIFPAIIFLFVTDNSFGGFGLLAWGILAVGLIDNFLSPRLVGRGMKLHPLLVFISVLGGLAFFGPLGFLLGPLAVSVFLALIDIYFSIKK